MGKVRLCFIRVTVAGFHLEIKNRLRNRLAELSLSNLMKIVIESPEKLTDLIWKKLLTCGIEKGRQIAV